MALVLSRVHDMAIAPVPPHTYSGSMPQQSLPSFRELLPELMEREIDERRPEPTANSQATRPLPPPTTTYDDIASSRPRTVSASSPTRAVPQSALLSETASRYSPYPTSSDRHYHQRRPTSQGRSPPYVGASPALPSFKKEPGVKREIDSLSDRHYYSDTPRHYSPTYSSRNGYSSAPSVGHHSPEFPTYSRRASVYDTSSRVPYPPMIPPSLAPLDMPRYASTPYDRPSYMVPYGMDPDYPSHYHPESSRPGYGVLGCESSDVRNKRRRGNLPKPVTDILRAWFMDHLDHPYPSEEDKQMFISRTGLSISQISNWFINARRRQLPALRNQQRSSDHERKMPRYASQNSSLSP